MGRSAKIWLRESTGWYCATINGEQVKLSQDKATRAFHALKAQETPETSPVFVSFRKIADEFLGVTEKTKSHWTFKNRCRVLKEFCKFIKAKKAAEVREKDVTGFLLSKKT